MPAQPTRSMFTRPRTLTEALTMLAKPDAVVLSGGTDFYPQRLNRSRAGRPAEHVVDIGAIETMRGIDETADGWRIGATTTWAAVAGADLPPMFDGLRAAARQVGGVQIQNAGTIAGNLCTASPAADGVPPLLTLDASVEIASLDGRRLVALDQFVTGYRSTALRPGELVTAILVPTVSYPHAGSSANGVHDRPADVRSSFAKLGSRAYLVISIAMVAALVVVQDSSIVAARLAVGSCSPVARRLPALEAALAGASIDDVVSIGSIVRSTELHGLAPIDDVRASGEYRREVVPQLIVDALAACTSPLVAGARP